MKNNFFLALLVSTFLFTMSSCGSKKEEADDSAIEETTDANSGESENATSNPSTYDPKRGEGKFNASNVTLGSLDATKATKGEAIVNTKCASCHKLTDEKLVGPGWKGVTTRREPYWIMNFITNPDAMINKDPAVKAMLELCLVRMPNQNLNDNDARDILEFMRKNDGVK